MSGKPTFSCQGCAKCCSNLIVREKAGLMLLPEEVSLFPEALIKPCLAIGTFPQDRKFIILTFQLTEMVCPYLKDKKCMIYNKRPVSCRAYPVVDRPKEPGLGLASECTEYIALKKQFGAKFELNIPNEYLIAHRFMGERVIPFRNLHDIGVRRWVYNLKTNKWELYKN